MRITGAQVFDLQEGFVQRDICFDGRLLSGSSADGKTYDASGCYVIPGLTDVHFHGCMGRDFSDAEPEGLEIMAQYELSRGVTQICPAGMTLTEEQLTKICQVAAAHRAADKPGAALCGINLEGPFLSMAKKGAQTGAWLHAPDVAMFRRLMAASQGLVWAPWCAPCRMVVPIMEEIASERPDIKVGKINVDEQPELASKFGIMSIPTLVVMKNGKIVTKVSGARPKKAILEML